MKNFISSSKEAAYLSMHEFIGTCYMQRGIQRRPRRQQWCKLYHHQVEVGCCTWGERRHTRSTAEIKCRIYHLAINNSLLMLTHANSFEESSGILKTQSRHFLACVENEVFESYFEYFVSFKYVTKILFLY